MDKYIQKKLDKEQELNARKAATSAFNEVLGTDYHWPTVNDDDYDGNFDRSREIGYENYNVVPQELVELLLEKKLASESPKQPKYHKVQEFFDNAFISWQNTTKYNAKEELKNKLLMLGIFGLLPIVFLVFLYFSNSGMFQHDVILDGDNFFTIKMPGNFKEDTVTLGTADAPLFRKIYTYKTNSENENVIFRVTENRYPGIFTDEQVNDLFLKLPEGELIQNYSSNSSDQKETIQEETNGTYSGYPSIDEVKKVNDLNIITFLRYIKVGHIIYEVSLTSDNDFFNKNTFSKYADSLKLLLNDQIKIQQ